MSNRFDVLERFAPLFPAPEPSFDEFLRRRDRRRRNRRMAAGIVGIVFFVAPVAFLAGRISGERTHHTQVPATRPTTAPAHAPGFVLDLRTVERTPLAESLANGLRFAASPDGTKLAYMGYDREGIRQIFAARVDGTAVRQLTHDPTGATSPAWSPDGNRIAYVGGGSEYFGSDRHLVVLDMNTGESTQVGGETGNGADPQFTPDGESLVYSGVGVLRIVPIAGGESALLIGPGQGLKGAGNGSLSPDGSLVTFLGSGRLSSAQIHCGPCRVVANADGTGIRVIPGWISNPAGTWSPDGSRIVCLSSAGGGVMVVDVTTGTATYLGEGNGAVWLDNHTLLIEVVHPVDPGPG